MRVLAIGATGQFGRLVVPALVSRGVQVRALVHDPAQQDRVRDAGADQQLAVEHGAFALPYSKASAMTFVDCRDVAEAAAIAFTTGDLVNGTFELAAGGAWRPAQS